MRKANSIEITKSIAVYSCKKGQGESFNYLEMTEYENGNPTKSYPAPLEFFIELSKNFQADDLSEFSFNRFSQIEEQEIKLLSFKSSLLNTRIVFYTPATKKPILFKKSLEMKSGYYPVPALVWSVDKKEELRVFAVKQPIGTLHEDCELFHPPFMNITNGKVCLGTMVFPKNFNNGIEQLASLIVEGFYQSIFTHFGSSGITKSNYYELFKSLQGGEVFPDSELVSLNKKLKEIL